MNWTLGEINLRSVWPDSGPHSWQLGRGCWYISTSLLCFASTTLGLHFCHRDHVSQFWGYRTSAPNARLARARCMKVAGNGSTQLHTLLTDCTSSSTTHASRARVAVSQTLRSHVAANRSTANRRLTHGDAPPRVRADQTGPRTLGWRLRLVDSRSAISRPDG